MRPSVLLKFLVLLVSVPAHHAQESPSDIDQFMARVLEKRKVNWDELQHYVFNETEVLQIRGMRLPPQANFTREYVWFVRDGYLIRSPVRADGARLSAEEQASAEERWLRRQKKDREEFLEREAFFNFKFDKGRYVFAGTQEFDGRNLVVVEYYPDKEAKKRRQKKDDEDKYEEMFEKTLLVTLWIDPDDHQIVKMTLDTLGLDFLPFRWLVRLQEIRASLILDKPLGTVWLPRDIVAAGSVDTAAGTLSLKYSRHFHTYAKTDVKVKLRYEGIIEERRKP